jgi:hypothetical protein
MPSTALRPCDIGLSRVERLKALGRAGRLGHYERGELSIADLSVWAARYPEEVPLVNGEYAWITSRLPA